MSKKLKSHNLQAKKGFSLVEAVLASALLALLVTAFMGAVIFGRENTAVAGARARAALLAEEGLEAVRNIGDAGFTNLTDGSHGLTISGNKWIFSGTTDAVDAFTRHILISSSGSSRKYVTSTVTWQQTPSRSGEVNLVTLATNWLKGAAGGCLNPYQKTNLNLSGAQDGLKIQVQDNYAYIVRNDSTPDFLVIDVTDTSNPNIVGSLTLSGIPSNIVVSGNYAYVSTSDDSSELQVIDVSNPASPSLAGSFNAAGTANANGIYINGSSIYLVRDSSTDDEFLIINVSTPTSPTLTGSLDLGDKGYEVFVSGNNAAIASGHNSQELQIVDISSPGSPSLVGSYNISGNTDALTVSGSGNYIFLGQGNNFNIFNISTPSSPTLSGIFDTTGSVLDIALNLGGSTSVYIGTDVANKEFQVIDVSTPSAPTRLCFLDITGNTPLNGIAYSESKDTAFTASSKDDSEFVTIAPQ